MTVFFVWYMFKQNFSLQISLCFSMHPLEIILLPSSGPISRTILETMHPYDGFYEDSAGLVRSMLN